MKALSVRPPFAQLIASGEKTAENRSWLTHHRGDLLIVASRTVDEAACRRLRLDPATLARGVAICVVDVVDVTGTPGAYAWHLARPRRVEPVAIRGFAALFHVSDDLIRFV